MSLAITRTASTICIISFLRMLTVLIMRLLQDWTIIRPGGLKSDHPTGKAILTEDIMASGSVDRADVADVVIKVLGTEGKCTRREFTVVDPTYNPEYDYKPFII